MPDIPEAHLPAEFADPQVRWAKTLVGYAGQTIQFIDKGYQQQTISMAPYYANAIRRIALEEGTTVSSIIRQALAWYCNADSQAEHHIPYTIGMNDQRKNMVRVTFLMTVVQMQDVDAFIKTKALTNPRWKTISRAAVVRMALFWRERQVYRMIRSAKATKGGHTMGRSSYMVWSLWRPTPNHRRED